MKFTATIRTLETQLELEQLEGQYLESLKEIDETLDEAERENFRQKVTDARNQDYPKMFQMFDAILEEHKES